MIRRFASKNLTKILPRKTEKDPRFCRAPTRISMTRYRKELAQFIEKINVDIKQFVKLDIFIWS